MMSKKWSDGMSFLNVSITPRAAAKLVLSGEIDLLEKWNTIAAQDVLLAISKLSVTDILGIVDSNLYGNVADPKSIPQFGKLETIPKVPSIFLDQGLLCIDYPQLGFYLKRDVNATLVANTKFGENHGKVATMLGLIGCVKKRFVLSSLTEAFYIADDELKNQVLNRLWFRIPIVQILLKMAKDNIVNGYIPMQQLKESTMHRRGRSVQSILNYLKTYNDNNLTKRIENVIWKDITGEKNANDDN